MSLLERELRTRVFIALRQLLAHQSQHGGLPGDQPETLNRPFVSSNGLGGGNHSHGGESHLEIFGSESGHNLISLRLPQAAWDNIIKRKPDPWVNDLVDVLVFDHAQPFNGEYADKIRVAVSAFGDWEQLGLEGVLAYALHEMLVAHLKQGSP